MHWCRRSWGSLVLLLGLLGALPAREADKAPKKEIPPLTDASLLAMLEKLGYEPRVYGTEKRHYELTVTTEEFKSVFATYLGRDQSRLWLVTFFRKLIDVDAVPADALLRFLRWNDANAPFHFTFDEKQKQFYLQFSCPNKGIDAAYLNYLIEQMAGNIRKTQPDWQYAVLQPPRPVVDGPEAAKERKKFAGTWVVHSFRQDGKTTDAKGFAGYVYEFEGTACVHGNTSKRRFLMALEPQKSPKEMDLRTDLAETDRAIYKWEGDDLVLCVDTSGKSRPTTFDAPAGAKVYLLTLKRPRP
jgi:uncharacterized protein (TIGR03067 family)